MLTEDNNQEIDWCNIMIQQDIYKAKSKQNNYVFNNFK